MKKKIKLLYLLILIPFTVLQVNAKEGWIKEKEDVYYYQKENKVEGFQIIEGKNYFFEIGSGKLLKGWQNYDGKFYADEETGEIKQGWQHIGVEDYYIKDNHTVEGFQTIDGKNYFFGIGSNRLLHGWQNYEGKFYADEKTGEIKQGWQHIGVEDYYIKDNHTVEGFQTIDGKNYFFGIGSNRLLHGWQIYNNKWFYGSLETGEFYKGNQKIDGRDYCFDTNTGILGGFKEKDGKKYYYNPDGTQAKGVQYMTNQFWKFNEITGEFEKFVREVRTIDVSSHQGNIDWEAVKASGKVDAVILRLGYGVGYVDAKFIRNKNELERLGIPYSVYLFSYAENKNEALMESNFLVNTLKDNDAKIASNIFSLYYDLEDWNIKSTGENSYGISKDTYGEMIDTFIDNTEKKTCIKTRVYASKSYIENRFPEDKQQYATWVAQWNDTLTYKGPYEGWQYSDCEYIPGINGCVDMSKFYY